MKTQITSNLTLTAPGPKGIPILGSIPEFRKWENPFDMWLHMQKEYGDIFRLKLGPREMYVISNPDIAQYVLQINNRNYWKGERMNILRPLVGNGLLTSEGDFWRRQRRLSQPAFHRKQIEDLARVMIETTAIFLENLTPTAETGETLDLSNALMRLTLDIVSKTLFSTALSEEEINKVAETMTPVLLETNKRVNQIFDFFHKLPTPNNQKYNEGIRVLDEIVYRMIEERRKSGEMKEDLLSMLMEARDLETNEGMSDKQLRDEVMTIFLAGHETTAVTLSWVFGLLSQHPDIRKKLQSEIDTILGGRIPTPNDVRDLMYTRMVIDEAMRIYPPAVAVARSPIEDDNLGGYPVKTGAHVIINIYALHRHPSYWENPEGFDPERFHPDKIKDQHKYAYIPFSSGPRICIGNNFALMEATLILAMITQKFEFNLAPGTKLTPQMTLTLRPKAGLPMVVKRVED